MAPRTTGPETTLAELPGELLEAGQSTDEVEVEPDEVRVGTERYWSPEFQALEEASLWGGVWQIAGRADDVPNPGDWLEHRILGQSYLVVRGHDAKLRAFVNACRHRGNRLCEGRGNAAVLTCGYHMWQFDLDGKLRRVKDAHTFCRFERTERNLIEIRADTYGGFVFVNPDQHAPPLAQFLDPLPGLLSAYHLDDMVPSVLNVRQPLACNWKLGVEAFMEAYHLESVHPHILAITDDVNLRFTLLGRHSAFVEPMAKPSPRLGELDPAEVVNAFLALGAIFAGERLGVNPLEAVIAPYRAEGGDVELPPGVTIRSLFGRYVRQRGVTEGHDYSQLTDGQMADSYNFLLFPNTILIMRPGECLYLAFWPDPDGDANRCLWDVATLKWISDEAQRSQQRAPRELIAEEQSVEFTLDQDRYQMARQQRGLRGRSDSVLFSKQEIRLVHFHRILDRHLGLAP